MGSWSTTFSGWETEQATQMPPLLVVTLASGASKSTVGTGLPKLSETPQSVGTGIGTPSYKYAVAACAAPVPVLQLMV